MGTALGRNLDPLADKVLNCGAFIFLLPAGEKGGWLLPWMVAVIVLRELIITSLRSFMETTGAKFGADWFGKLKTVLQFAALIAIFSMLWLRSEPGGSSAVPDWVCLGLVYATVVATVLSGLQYIWRAIVLFRTAPGRDAEKSAVTNDFGCAIVGVGMIARFHVRALAEVPGARVAALVSRSPDNARKAAADLGLDCPIFSDLATALARPDVHAVIVTTPSGAHLEPAVAAARAGKHVVVEKPLEITAERCDRIIEACDRNGVKLCTIFPSRFADANGAEGGRGRRQVRPADAGRDDLQVAAAAVVLRPGRLEGHAGPRRRRRPHEPGHSQRRSLIVVDGSGDARHRLHRHAGPRAHRGGGHGRRLSAVRRRGAGVIQATTSVYPGLPKTIAVHGDHGTAVVEQDDVLRWDFTPETAEDRAVKERFARKVGASGGASDPAAISHQGHARQLADFVHAVRTGGKPLVDGREGRRSVEVIEAVYWSARTGRTVELRASGAA